jgi:hypothetical protein
MTHQIRFIRTKVAEDFTLFPRSMEWLQTNVGALISREKSQDPNGRWHDQFWADCSNWDTVKAEYLELTDDHYPYDGIEIAKGEGWCILSASGWQLDADSAVFLLDDELLAVQFKLAVL